MDSGIPKRLRKALEAFFSNDLEESLYQVASAIEATAKMRYPAKNPSTRVQKFLKDEQDLLFGLATGNGFKINPRATMKHGDDGELQRIIYKYIRCAQSHEARFDDKKIQLGGEFGIGRIVLQGTRDIPDPGKYIISKAAVMAMIFSVVCATENKDLDLSGWNMPFLSESKIYLSNFLGKKNEFISFYSDIFDNLRRAQ